MGVNVVLEGETRGLMLFLRVSGAGHEGSHKILPI